MQNPIEKDISHSAAAETCAQGEKMREMPGQPISLADYSQEQIDALAHGEIAARLRRYGHPLLTAAADSIDYLGAQEGLLERAQQAAERARADLAEHKRPLDEPMARLNRRVIELTAELDTLRLGLPAGVQKGTAPLSFDPGYVYAYLKAALASVEPDGLTDPQAAYFMEWFEGIGTADSVPGTDGGKTNG